MKCHRSGCAFLTPCPHHTAAPTDDGDAAIAREREACAAAERGNTDTARRR